VRSWRRRFAGGALGVVLAASTFASAASLSGVNSADLAAGTSAVETCDPGGVTVAYTVILGLVTQVTVGDIAPACAGGILKVTLANAAGSSIGAGGPGTIGGSSEVLELNPQPLALLVAATHVVIEGP
jgi:hypothetical protein